MKILHGHIRTSVRVRVDDQNATPENPMGHEYVQGHGFYDEFADSTFSIDPDGTLYLYRDRSNPGHASYGSAAWFWVTDENDNSAFNTLHPIPTD